MKDIAVYSFLVGDYDGFNDLDPAIMEPEIDYYFFTNNRNIVSKYYTIVYIDVEDSVLETYHFHGHRIPDIIRAYKYSIFYDANAYLTRKISGIISELDPEVEFLSFMFPIPFTVKRYFIKQEVYGGKSLYIDKYNQYIADGWKDDKYFSNTKVMVRRHTPRLFAFSDFWFKEMRGQNDEFALYYCAWKHNLNMRILYPFHILRYFIIQYHKNSKSGGGNNTDMYYHVMYGCQKLLHGYDYIKSFWYNLFR